MGAVNNPPTDNPNTSYGASSPQTIPGAKNTNVENPVATTLEGPREWIATIADCDCSELSLGLRDGKTNVFLKTRKGYPLRTRNVRAKQIAYPQRAFEPSQSGR